MDPDGAGGFKCQAGFECKTQENPGGGKGSFAPGDWNCPACNDHQFARNSECRKCGMPRPSDSVSGAWGGCGNIAGKGNSMMDQMWAMMAMSFLKDINKHSGATNGGGCSNGGCASWPGSGGGCSSWGSSAGAGDISPMHAAQTAVGGCGGGGCGSWAGLPMFGGCSSGGGGKGGGDSVCSEHGKKRTAQNLMDDGMGGMKCRPGNECNGMGTTAGKGAKPGDWNCPQCNDLQFARNSDCRKCGCPRPAEAGGDRFSPY